MLFVLIKLKFMKSYLLCFLFFASQFLAGIDAFAQEDRNLPGEGGGLGIELLILIIIVVVIVVVAFVSYAWGVFESFDIPKTNPPGDPRPEEDCSQCQRDRIWYSRQPRYKQLGIAVWWLANRAACSAKGCGDA